MPSAVPCSIFFLATEVFVRGSAPFPLPSIDGFVCGSTPFSPQSFMALLRPLLGHGRLCPGSAPSSLGDPQSHLGLLLPSCKKSQLWFLVHGHPSFRHQPPAISDSTMMGGLPASRVRLHNPSICADCSWLCPVATTFHPQWSRPQRPHPRPRQLAPVLSQLPVQSRPRRLASRRFLAAPSYSWLSLDLPMPDPRSSSDSRPSTDIPNFVLASVPQTAQEHRPDFSVPSFGPASGQVSFHGCPGSNSGTNDRLRLPSIPKTEAISNCLRSKATDNRRRLPTLATS